MRRQSLSNLAIINLKKPFFSRGIAKITEKLPLKEKEYKDRLITSYFPVRTNQPSPSFLSCKLENKKNLVAKTYNVAKCRGTYFKTLRDDRRACSISTAQKISRLRPNICSGQI